MGPALSSSLEPLSHRCDVAGRSLFCKYYPGVCSSKLSDLFPASFIPARLTRWSSSLHNFAVKVTYCSTSSYSNSFFSRTARLWNSLPTDSSLLPITLIFSRLASIGTSCLLVNSLFIFESSSLSAPYFKWHYALYRTIAIKKEKKNQKGGWTNSQIFYFIFHFFLLSNLWVNLKTRVSIIRRVSQTVLTSGGYVGSQFVRTIKYTCYILYP